MGQYFKVANLTKRQYFSADIFNEGIKSSNILHGIHGYALGKLLAFGLPDLKPRSQEKKVDYGLSVGCWAGDRTAVVGDQSNPAAGFLEVAILKPDTKPIILDDILYQEFENIGGRLICWMVNDNKFAEWLVKEVQRDESYLGGIGYIAYQFPGLSRELIGLLNENWNDPSDWQAQCKRIWGSTFIPPDV